MAIHEETRLRPFYCGAVILLLLLSVGILPFAGLRELFGRESEFAAMLAEISWQNPYPVVHGELLPYRYPLFPLLAKTLMGIFPLSPEWALRLMGFGSLLAIVVVIWNAAARGLRNSEAGAIAAAVTLTSLFMVDRAFWGVPDLLGAAFILGGWMLLFELGMGRNAWWRAWGGATVFLTLAFFTIGPTALLIFLLPIPFMPRPISGWKRLQRLDFILPICLAALLVIVWEAVRIRALPTAPAETVVGLLTHWRNNNVLWILSAPFDLFFRLLPWVLFLYPVFCPAYKVFERKPVFIRFTKTLFWVTAAAILLIPWFRIGDDAKILVPLMGILVAVHYPIFIRRNGTIILRILRPLNVLLLLAAFVVLGYHVLTPQLATVLNQVQAVEGEFLGDIIQTFRNLWIHEEKLLALRPIAIAASCFAMLLSLILIAPVGRRLPVWVQISLMMAVLAQLHWATSWHRQTFDTEYRDRASRIRETLAAQTPTPIADIVIYKTPRAPKFYAEGVYLGARMHQLRSLSELPSADTTIYLLSSDIPTPVAGWRWDEKALLREPYYETYLYLWAGHAVNKDSGIVREPEKKSIHLLP